MIIRFEKVSKIGLASVLALSLAACCAKVENNAASAAAPSNEYAGKSEVVAANSSEFDRTIYFAYDSSKLPTEAQEKIAAQADFINKHPGVKVNISGFTDERGSDAYNDKLGAKRAAAVRDSLISAGVPSERLVVRSKGKTAPYAAGHDETSYSQNRRALIAYEAS